MMNDYCKLCESLGVKLGDPIKFTDKSTKIEHALLHLRQIRLVKKTKIARVFDQCFPKSVGDQQGGDVNENSRSRIVSLCKTVFYTISSPVTCQQCEMSMSSFFYQSKKCWQWNQIIDHACRHLGKAVYKCSHCDYKAALKHTILHHMSKVHQVKAKEGENFDDMSPIYEDEIKESIKSCFEEGAPTLPINNVKIKSRSEDRVWGQLAAPGNKLKLDRHLLVQGLLTEFSNENGKIQCRVCSKVLTSGRVVYAMDHAQSHLEKAIYKCKICPYVSSRCSTIQVHMSRKHKVTCSGNYEDRADEFHKEIMDIVRKCFGGKND